MDFDPRITSDGSGHGCEHGWGCNFSFGYGYDIIAEDTETEKCCVKALQLLIAKADAEIRDLEDELAILQCQLKWAEYEEQVDPYEVSCAAFRLKIDSLASSIQSLSDGNMLSGIVTDETSEIQRPAKRINDIIKALIGHRFSLLDEEVVLNGKDPLANLGSNTDTELIWQAAVFESSVESGEPMIAIETQPAHAISEESSSDAARYASKDPIKGRDVCNTDVEVMGRAQLDVDKCILERRRGPLCVQPVMTPTHFQACHEGNSMFDALPSGEAEERLAGSKIGESGLAFLSVKIEPSVKFEDDYDMSIQQVAVDSLPMIQDHEIEDLVEDHLKETENRPQSVVNTPITYNRRKFGLSSITEGQKVQRKAQSILSGVEPATPSLMAKPLRKIGKKESPSNAKKFGPLGMTTSNAERIFPFPESNWQRKLRINESMAYANTSGVLQANRRQIQGANGESPSIHCLEVRVSNKTSEVFGAKSKSLNGRQMLHKSPDIGEVESSIVASDSTDANDVDMAENPINDLENLRIKLEEDPCFLNKLKVSELKEIMKQNKMRGSYKLRKEKIVEELTKRLCL